MTSETPFRRSDEFNSRLRKAIQEDDMLDRLHAIADIVEDVLENDDVGDDEDLVRSIAHRDIVGTDPATAMSIDQLLNDLRWFAHNQSEIPGIGHGPDVGPLQAFTADSKATSTAMDTIYDLAGQVYAEALLGILDARESDDEILEAVYESIYDQCRDPRVLKAQMLFEHEPTSIGPKQMVENGLRNCSLEWSMENVEKIARRLIRTTFDNPDFPEFFPPDSADWSHPASERVEEIIASVEGQGASGHPVVSPPELPDSVQEAQYEAVVESALGFLSEQENWVDVDAAKAIRMAASDACKKDGFDPDGDVGALELLEQALMHRLNIAQTDDGLVYTGEWEYTAHMTDDGRFVVDAGGCPVCESQIINGRASYGVQLVGSPGDGHDFHADDSGWSPSLEWARCGKCDLQLL